MNGIILESDDEEWLDFETSDWAVGSFFEFKGAGTIMTKFDEGWLDFGSSM